MATATFGTTQRNRWSANGTDRGTTADGPAWRYHAAGASPCRRQSGPGCTDDADEGV